MELSVSFRKSLTAANRRVDIDVRFTSRAERLVLFGPSGAGKSLTLQAIAGLIVPDTGRIAFGAEVWFDADSGIERPARARGVGLMFQDYALFPHLTVAGNVGATHQRGWPRKMDAAARREVDGLLHTFGLRSLADSYPSQLSGGQRQRTALARALAGNPRLLLLDEPFASLDETLRRSARNELLALQAQCHVPMVVITHDPRDVDVLAQDVVALDAGRVVTMPDAAPKVAVPAVDGLAAPL
jgi:molybdate transport system ATP-binding protein